MSRAFESISIVAALAMLGGCPAQVEHHHGVAAQRPAAAREDDPRVAKDGEDLYPAASVERAESKTRPAVDPTAGRGSGKPDESNGKCRLYAPKLAEPECCNPEFGFDVDVAREACDLDVYLGESWQNTCGYYFHRPDGRSTWFRASFINTQTALEAAEALARQLREKSSEEIRVERVPGTKDGYWLTHQQFGWAYVGGWEAVRQFAWREDSCSADGVAKILASMEAAKPPAEGAKRLALVPKAR